MTQTLIGLVLAATFLVPGSIYRNFRNRFLVIQAVGNQQENMIANFTSGLWNFVLTFPILSFFGVDPLGPALAATDVPTLVNAVRVNGLAWFLQLAVAPVFLAVAMAFINRKRWTQKMLGFLGIRAQMRHASAWDAAYYHIGDREVLVGVAFKDPGRPPLYGRLGANSAASPNAVNNDIYLDAVYVPCDATGTLSLDEDAIGMFISEEEVSALTFIRMPESVDDVAEEVSTDVATENANGQED